MWNLSYFASIRKAPLTPQRCVHGFMVGLHGSRVSLSGSMVSQRGPRVNLHGPRVEATQLQGRPPLSTALGWSSKASGRQSTATVWALGSRPEALGLTYMAPWWTSTHLLWNSAAPRLSFDYIMPSGGYIAINLILSVHRPHLKIYRWFLFGTLLPFLLHSYAFPWTNTSNFLSQKLFTLMHYDGTYRRRWDEWSVLKRWRDYLLKRVWHEIFSVSVFFMNQLPPRDTSDKHLFANISSNFRKIRNSPNVTPRGPGDTYSWKNL